MDNEEYANPYSVENWRDVLNLAWMWRAYWQVSKRIMLDGYHWYHKEIPILTPKQVEPHVPSTAATLVNDAADHLAGNNPFYNVKALRESQRADEDRQRVQTCLNSAFDVIGRQYGHPLHRTLAIHGGWSGMMCARIGVREGWDIDNPTIEDIRWEPQNPLYVYPDPGTGGRKAVIVWMHKSVGEIRRQFQDWDGHWFLPNTANNQFYASPYVDNAMGGFIGQPRQRLNKPLNDNTTVDWVEYWDEGYKCFIANGVPIFAAEYDEPSGLIEHGLGTMPFIIRSCGYSDDTGDGVHRYKSMLAQVFSELDTEAALLTQLKWIVQETAWPVWLAPKDTEGEFDLEPGSLNFIENADSIKAIRALREDAVKPDAIMQLLQYIKDEIERATYPVILKGQQPKGITAGYPIAILSTQARLKFAAPTEALQEIFKDLGYKTLTVVKERFKVATEVIDGYSLKPEDIDKYMGRIQIKLEPQLPQDLASKLPILEFLLGSAGFSKSEAIRELGYENPEEIRELRMAEDMEDDPRTKQVLVEHLITLLSPEAAAAVQQVAEPQLDVQMLTSQLQEMQTRMQYMEMYQQMQQMHQQMQGMQPPPGLNPPEAQPNPLPPIPIERPAAPGGPGGPAMAPPAAPIVPGSAGGTNFGQNLGAPGPTKGGLQLNPDTALQVQARMQNAIRSLGVQGAENNAYGPVRGGAL